MNAFIRRHISELVSLTVLLLMTVALIGGQADAMLPGSVPVPDEQQEVGFTANLDAMIDSARVRARLVIDIEADGAAETSDVASEFLTISLLGLE